MKQSERCMEVPLKDAKAGMWAKFTLTEDFKDNAGKVRFKAGEFMVRLVKGFEGDPLGLMLLTLTTGVTSILGMPDEDAEVFPLIQFNHEGVNVAPQVTDLHVDTADPKDAAIWNGVTPPTLQNARIGDHVTLSNAHYPDSVVTGLVQNIIPVTSEEDSEPAECGMLHVAGKYYLIDGTDTDDTWHIDSLKRRVNWNVGDLPKEPGLYKAATGSVWKFDGRHFVPVLTHDGKTAPAHPVPMQSRDEFLKTSLTANRFPFAKVKVSFDVVE